MPETFPNGPAAHCLGKIGIFDFDRHCFSVMSCARNSAKPFRRRSQFGLCYGEIFDVLNKRVFRADGFRACSAWYFEQEVMRLYHHGDAGRPRLEREVSAARRTDALDVLLPGLSDELPNFPSLLPNSRIGLIKANLPSPHNWSPHCIAIARLRAKRWSVFNICF